MIFSNFHLEKLKNWLFEKVRLFEQQKCINNNVLIITVIDVTKNNMYSTNYLYIEKLINSAKIN